jgi:hypothetical protein
MTKIAKPLERATVAETCNLTLNMGEAVKESSVDDDHLNQKADELSSKGQEMETSIAKDQGKAKTAELVDADSERDALISSLKLFLRAHMKWKRENLSKNASILYKIIKKHGLAMADENYEEESTLLDSLLAELAKPKNVQFLEELKLSELIADLNAAEDYFKKLYLEAIKIEATKEAYISATILKKELLVLQKKMVNYLNAMQQANPEKFAAVSKKIAELVKIMNRKIRNRSAKKKKK